MGIPTGYALLGVAGFSPKGTYNAQTTYNKYNTVYYLDSTYYAKEDGLLGITPVDGENWGYVCRGTANGLETETNERIKADEQIEEAIEALNAALTGEIQERKSIVSEAGTGKETYLLQGDGTWTDRLGAIERLLGAEKEDDSILQGDGTWSDRLTILENMVYTNHFAMSITCDGDYLTDESGNLILGDFKFQIA